MPLTWLSPIRERVAQLRWAALSLNEQNAIADDVDRLLRAVEVLEEAVGRVARDGCLNGFNVCREDVPDEDVCSHCRARRALADVRDTTNA